MHQLIILLLLFISGVLKIHNSILNPFKLFLRIVILFKPFNSTGAISLKQSFPTVISRVGPNPQVFSQDLTWLFFSGVFWNSFQVWRKNDPHQSHAFSKLVFNYFHLLLHLPLDIRPEYLEILHGISRLHSQHLKTGEVFLLNLGPFSWWDSWF